MGVSLSFRFFGGFVFWLFFIGLVSGNYKDKIPAELHLSLTGEASSMFIMWSTVSETPYSMSRWGFSPTHLVYSCNGSSHHYINLADPFYRSPQLHLVTLTGLEVETRYYYQVGDPTVDRGWSDVYSFVSQKGVSPSTSLSFFAFGDHGHSPWSVQVIDSMLYYQWTHNSSSFYLDFLILAGDISYADEVQHYWDDWAVLVSPLTQPYPMMTAIGNHELFDLTLSYEARFQMPKNGRENKWYSYEIGNAHIIMLSSEQLDFDYRPNTDQYKWLEKDLMKVDRKVTPWLIVVFHTPFYCSNKQHQNAGDNMRDHGMEDVFYAHKVDLVINGHVHIYERTNPVYKGKVNEEAPTYIVVGNGGSGEGLAPDAWTEPHPEWSAKRIHKEGFAAVNTVNQTHLHWQLILAPENTVADDFWLIRKRE